MKRLAICGSHSRTREQAPWNDAETEIWVLNEMPQAEWCKRWDVCFQLHKEEVYTSPNNMSCKTHWEWLQQDHGDRIIYMQDFDSRVPNCKRYPLEEILDHVPGASLRWFKSSTSYAMAMAIYLGYGEVDFYGMDMSSNTEYGFQLANFQFWVGVMLGCGIKIGVLSNEQFFHDRLYGYEGEIQLSQAFFAERVAFLKEEGKKKDWMLEKVKNRMADAFANGKAEKIAKLMQDYEASAYDAGELAGALSEAETYKARLDPISRQEFERRAAAAIRDSEDRQALMHHAAGKAEYVWNVWNLTQNPQALAQLKTFIGEQVEHAYHAGATMGAHRENYLYLDEVDKRIEAAGGYKTVRALQKDLSPNPFTEKEWGMESA